MSQRHLVVMGPMGVGKTTLAGLLGRRLGRPARDSDTDIEALFGRSGRSIAADQGVDVLHDLEAAVLLGALADSTPAVIAAAGWTVEHPGCRGALARRAVVVVLDLVPAGLIGRLAQAEATTVAEGGADGGHRRPMSTEEIETVARSRRPLYEEAADLWLDATRTPEHLVDDVLAFLAATP